MSCNSDNTWKYQTTIYMDQEMKSDIFFVEKGFIRDGEQLQPLFF